MIASLDQYRRKRCKPYASVWFASERAAQLFGEEFRLQQLYAWSLIEAQEIAEARNGRIQKL